MCTHSIDDLLPHAPLHYAATGEMVKGSYIPYSDYNYFCPSLHLVMQNDIEKNKSAQVTKSQR